MALATTPGQEANNTGNALRPLAQPMWCVHPRYLPEGASTLSPSAAEQYEAMLAALVQVGAADLWGQSWSSVAMRFLVF